MAVYAPADEEGPVVVAALRTVAALVVVAAGAGCAGPDDAGDATPIVAILRSVPDPAHDAFLDELRAQRLLPGRDLVIEPSDPELTYADEEEAAAALDELAADPTLIVAYSTPYARLAAERYPGVPVVSVVNDPVAVGLLGDRDQPEGSVTGVTFAVPADRTLELTEAVVGGLDRIGFLVPSGDAAIEGPRDALREAASARGTEVVEATFDGPDDVDAAVGELAAVEVDAVLVGASNAVIAALDAIEAATDAVGLPVVANNGRATFAVAVLEPDGAEVRRQVARQVARLLAGEPVATVSVEDPRRLRTTIDRTRAASLGLPELDDRLLRQADVVR